MTNLSRRQFLQLSLTGAARMLMPPGLYLDRPQPVMWPPTFNVASNVPMIALTHDDACNNVTRLLDICRELDLQLTLFPIGKMIDAFPTIWKRAVAEGHEIGCHTYNHPALGGQGYDAVAKELDLFMVAVRKALGDVPVRYFRPPYGSGWYEPALQQAAADFGMRLIMWNRINPLDLFSLDGSSPVAAKFREQASPGDIFLYHFNIYEVEATRAIVDFCRSKSWRIVPISQLLKA